MTDTPSNSMAGSVTGSVTSGGRLRQTGLATRERNAALWAHLSPLIAFCVVGPLAIIAPLIIWQTNRDSVFADDHGREVMNLSLTGLLLFVIGVITAVGVVVWLVWCVVAIVNIVRGSIAANNGEYFRYPVTLRFLS